VQDVRPRLHGLEAGREVKGDGVVGRQRHDRVDAAGDDPAVDPPVVAVAVLEALAARDVARLAGGEEGGDLGPDCIVASVNRGTGYVRECGIEWTSGDERWCRATVRRSPAVTPPSVGTGWPWQSFPSAGLTQEPGVI
jgi:hypothetical protein